MAHFDPTSALLGGALIGLASALLMLQTGIAADSEATLRCPGRELKAAENDAQVVSV